MGRKDTKISDRLLTFPDPLLVGIRAIKKILETKYDLTLLSKFNTSCSSSPPHVPLYR